MPIPSFPLSHPSLMSPLSLVMHIQYTSLCFSARTKLSISYTSWPFTVLVIPPGFTYIWHSSILNFWNCLDPEGWYGEGGGRGVQVGEHVYTMVDSCWCMAKPIQYCKVKINKNEKKINKGWDMAGRAWSRSVPRLWSRERSSAVRKVGAGRKYGEGNFFFPGVEIEQPFSTDPRVSEQLC